MGCTLSSVELLQPLHAYYRSRGFSSSLPQYQQKPQQQQPQQQQWQQQQQQQQQQPQQQQQQKQQLQKQERGVEGPRLRLW